MKKFNVVNRIEKILSYKTDNISIIDILNEKEIDLKSFLISIGINHAFLNSVYSDELLSNISSLLSNKNTTISYNEEMSSLNNDEISFYCRGSKTSISYQNDSIIVTESYSDKNNSYHKGEVYIVDENMVKKIYFEMNLEEGKKERLITHRDFLNEFNINANMDLTNNKRVIKTFTYNINSKGKVELIDALRLMRSLYTCNYLGSYFRFVDKYEVEAQIEDNFFYNNIDSKENIKKNKKI